MQENYQKKIFLRTILLTLGSISFSQQVLALTYEFSCNVEGAYVVNNRATLNPKGKKIYPTKLAKNKSEKLSEDFSVIVDIDQGKGTINGSEVKIISSRIDVSKELGPIASPVVLYSSGNNLWKSEGPINSNFNSGIFKKKEAKIYKKYLILDKGESSFSKFTLINTFENTKSEIKIYSNTKSMDLEKDISQEISYGYCKY
tara:strand:- start:404 stop:1006 length:603 start_codon:yes stop_codon:yes gene_type:complete